MTRLEILSLIIKEFKPFKLNEDHYILIHNIFAQHIELIHSLNPKLNEQKIIDSCLVNIKASIINSINLARINDKN